MTEEFDVDISARDLIAWIKVDQARPAPTLRVSASRSVEKTSMDLETAGVTLDDDVAETTTRGILEVSPRRGAGGWVLQVSVDDTAGEHPAGEEDTEEEVEGLDLEAFEQEFLVAEGRLADITVTVEDGPAKARFGKWLRRRAQRAYTLAKGKSVPRAA